MIILGIDTSCDDTGIALLKFKSQKFPKQNKLAAGWTKIKNVEVLSNVVSSQIKIHQKYGGVFPMMAKREHGRNLTFVLKKALQKSGLLKLKIKSEPARISTQSVAGGKLKAARLPLAIAKSDCQPAKLRLAMLAGGQAVQSEKLKKIKTILKREPGLLENFLRFIEKYEKPKIGALAVTIGPGLEPCLWAGVNFAKALGFYWNIPIIPINHIEAHIVANFLEGAKLLSEKRSFAPHIPLPAVCLVVSGGHTEIVLIEKIGKYKIIGQTRDDAAGECFDKTARVLGLPYPGGPQIAALAAKLGNKKFAICNLKFAIALPRPMENSGDLDFSFSGLKTAVLYDFQARAKKEKASLNYKQAMAFAIQEAIVDVLVKKTIAAAKRYKVKSILISGGVASNKQLKTSFKKATKTLSGPLNRILFSAPKPKLCLDNGAMVAMAGFFNLNKKGDWPADKAGWQKIKVNANLNI